MCGWPAGTPQGLASPRTRSSEAFAPPAVTWSVFGPSSETTRMGRHWDGAGCGGLGCGGHSASLMGASQGRGQVPVRRGPLTDRELGRVPSEDSVLGDTCGLGRCPARPARTWGGLQLPEQGPHSRPDLAPQQGFRRSAQRRRGPSPRLPWPHSRASEETRTCHDVC